MTSSMFMEIILPNPTMPEPTCVRLSSPRTIPYLKTVDIIIDDSKRIIQYSNSRKFLIGNQNEIILNEKFINFKWVKYFEKLNNCEKKSEFLKALPKRLLKEGRNACTALFDTLQRFMRMLAPPIETPRSTKTQPTKHEEQNTRKICRQIKYNSYIRTTVTDVYCMGASKWKIVSSNNELEIICWPVNPISNLQI
ncbi:hypothetical protein HELRODRAFT_180660 [Helobdella robusta]|uniref:Uncharacterized protein n=1 Tax=Helobdella robusta TaxID=6412 RepID=T1FG50_HELRO|nr:hypothetical protein HELRODRAFT_180660 [Helobdella robusta]ESN93790.1 hypothetical protein HELRODRAFT_180660 [Helobdella robusta]